ncbi:MAG: hypothetical protein JJ863_16345 [Deltaproteobacteria bacterium]|nr:hypothetical protein [Deltaproteobacteria bacterium]
MTRIAFTTLLLTLALGCGDDDGIDPTDGGATPDASTADAGPETTLAWHPVAEPAEGPLMVWGALVVDVGPTSAVLFGGTTATNIGGTTLDAAYRYDWEGDTLVASALGSTGPAARYCGCAAYDEARNVVIVAGGRDLSGPFLAAPETWELDLATEAWTQWSGTTPASTLGCMMTQGSDGELYWFGGVADSGASDVLYRAEDEGWVEVAVTGDRPAPRYDGVLWADGDDLVLFAGSRSALGAGFYADVWRFSGGAWTQEHDGGDVEGRRVPWFRATDDGFVFQGGYDLNMNPMAGLYRYVSGEGFSAIELADPLLPRGFAASFPAPSGIGVMFSGYDGDGPLREVLWLDER